MRTKLAALIVVVFVVSGISGNMASAQEVPTLGENGWVLPENDESNFDMGTAPAVAPTAATPSGGGSYEAAIHNACARHGCDPNQLIRVMYCESGGDPGAWHPNPYGGSDVGLFQIHDATWGGIAYADAYAQIEWAASMFATGQGYHWVCQ